MNVMQNTEHDPKSLNHMTSPFLSSSRRPNEALSPRNSLSPPPTSFKRVHSGINSNHVALNTSTKRTHSAQRSSFSLSSSDTKRCHLSETTTLAAHVDRTNVRRYLELEHSEVPPRSSLKALSQAVGGVVKRRKHIVLLGLDGSGKTTILLQLKYGCNINSTPTIGFNHEKIRCGGLRWSVWDVGGGERVRPLWATYARATDGIVFVLDASATDEGIEEARMELSKVVKISKSSSQQLNIVVPPVLILANFQDHPLARTAEEIVTVLGLQEAWAQGVAYAVAPVCGLTGEGLKDALQALRNLIDSLRKDYKSNTTKSSFAQRWLR